MKKNITKFNYDILNIEKIKSDCLNWLKSLETEKLKFKMCKNSCDEFLLDSISLAYDLKYMIGDYISEYEKDEAKDILDSYQDLDNGFFYEIDCDLRLDNLISRIKEMHGNYLTFQVIGAYKAINRLPKYKISFYDDVIDKFGISSYLSNNCPWEKSPWGAGGMIDNLATILDCNVRMGYKEYVPIIEEIFNWLEKNQSSETGLWGKPIVQGINGVINGSYHLMRGTYFLFNRPFKYSNKIIDTIIRDIIANKIFNKFNAHGCQDLDHFYLLSKCFKINNNYKESVIKKISFNRLKEIMNLVYCKDEGFSFEHKNSVKLHNYYKISNGIKEADLQGTVFYLQTIKSIYEILGIKADLNDSKTHG